MRLSSIVILLLITLAQPLSVEAGTAVDSLRKAPRRGYLKSRIIDGDTIPHKLLNEVTVIKPWEFKNKREQVQYSRLVRNIKITLPYARVSSAKLKEINDNLAKIPTDKERKAYLKRAEDELFAEFEAPLRKLSFSQGKLLIRLIDRETGNTGYELIRHYKGGLSAFFWQGIARIFGANLKDQYNAEEDDKMIEHIIRLIDIGAI